MLCLITRRLLNIPTKINICHRTSSFEFGSNWIFQACFPLLTSHIHFSSIHSAYPLFYTSSSICLFSSADTAGQSDKDILGAGFYSSLCVCVCVLVRARPCVHACPPIPHLFRLSVSLDVKHEGYVSHFTLF